jgi:hypothetical protein
MKIKLYEENLSTFIAPTGGKKRYKNLCELSNFPVEPNNQKYIETKDKKPIGIDGVREIIKNSHIAFVDCTRESAVHMGVKQFLDLKKEFSDKILVPTHMSAATRVQLARSGVRVPKDLWEIEL